MLQYVVHVVVGFDYCYCDFRNYLVRVVNCYFHNVVNEVMYYVVLRFLVPDEEFPDVALGVEFPGAVPDAEFPDVVPGEVYCSVVLFEVLYYEE